MCTLAVFFGVFLSAHEADTVSSAPSPEQGCRGLRLGPSPRSPAASGGVFTGSALLLLPLPLSSIYFPNLVRLPRSSLIGPWKISALWKSLAG